MDICAKCGKPEDEHVGLNGTTKVCPSGVYEPKVRWVKLKIGKGDGTYREVTCDAYALAQEIIEELRNRDHFIATISRS